MEDETIAITDSHVLVAFLSHTEATKEVWCRDYFCLPLNAVTSWWTDSPYIHVQIAFYVRISGGGRSQPENTFMTFSVDNNRGRVHAYENKQFSDEYAWTFLKYNLDRRLRNRKTGESVLQVNAAYDFCDAQVGKPARKWGMLASGLFGGFGGKRKSYFCSELLLEMFHEVGELSDVPATGTSPGELYHILNTRCVQHGAAYFTPHPRTFHTKEILF